MKAVWTVISILLLINVMALAGGASWLFRSGRMDRDRFERIREMLSNTIEQEENEKKMAQEAQEKSRQTAMEIARLEAVSSGPITLADRLRSEQRNDELAVQRVERLRRDISDLRRQLSNAQSLLAKKQTDIESQRTAFREAVERQAKLQEDADFQLTVQMLQQIKAKQAKQIVQQLLRQDKRSDVVEYLAAMQLRKAAAVIKSFKTPEEIVQATDLLQALRERGIELASYASMGSSPPKRGANPG